MSSLFDNARYLPERTCDIDALHLFSGVQLIAFDLDGTLLSHKDGAPGERMLQLKRSVARYGTMITIATGRTLYGARNVIDVFHKKNKSMPVVLYNGSVVFDVNIKNVILKNTISNDSALKIATIAQLYGADIFFYEFRDFFMEVIDENYRERVYSINFSGNPLKEFNSMKTTVITNMDNFKISPSAILLLPIREKDKINIHKDISSILDIDTTTSGGLYIEIRPAGSSKVSGLETIVNKLNISKEHVLTVGDNDNDVDMLQWAGVSVAVKGASAAAIHAAKYLSKNGPENAAIEVLDIVRQAKRLGKGGR